MSSLYEVIHRNFYPYRYVFLSLLLVIVFAIIAYIIFLRLKTPVSSVPFHNVANAQQRGVPIQVYFFYVDWCPHCKTAKPEWEAFRTEFDGKTIHNQTIECISMNCTDDSNRDVKIAMSDFSVNSFPHIVLVANGSHIEFDAKITKAALEQFIMTVTQ